MKTTLLFVASLLLCAACAGVGSESLIISEEDEITMGAQYHQALLKEMPEYTANPAVGLAITELGNQLAKESDRPDLKYTFTVVDSDEINAFAIPGGYVYVTRGLLEWADNGGEVATVLAHELGHISARHGVQAMETYMVAQGIYQILGSDQLATLVSGAIQVGAGLTFDKDQEREADSLGANYAAAAGFNPWAMVEFFERLKTLEPRTSSQDGLTSILTDLGELFSTHPPTDERIANTKKLIEELGITKDEKGYAWDFGDGLAALQAMFD